MRDDYLWKPAGQYLAARIKNAAAKGDWRGDWIEADIVNELKDGRLLARGRLLVFGKPTAWHAEQQKLLPGCAPSYWERVADIPQEFWSDCIFHSGGDVSRVYWPDCTAYVPPQWWSDIEIGELAPKPGRPFAFDWQTFDRVARSCIEEEGGFHPAFKQADLERIMRDWMLKNWQHQPNDRTLQRHIQAMAQRS